MSIQLAAVKRVIKARKSLKRRKGVSPLISTILIFALIIFGVGVGLVQTLPYIEISRARASLNNLQTAFNKIDSSINDLINEGTAVETIGGQQGQRFVTLSKNTGQIDFIAGSNYFNMRLVDQNRDPIYNGTTGREIEPLFGIEDAALGRIDYSFSTTASLIPLNSWKYLKGPSQYNRRGAIAVISPTQTEEYTDLTNLTLTYSSTDYLMHLRLDYRPKIVISIRFAPVPEIRISTFLIKITGSELPIYDNYRQLLVSLDSIDYTTSTYSISSSSGVTELTIQYRTSPVSGWTNKDSWTSKLISGLDPSLYKITISKIIYGFTIT
ncbi:MAG: hypothetical protein ACFFD4_18345 [Candidatus Odinarchaeota archaeon]